MRPRPVGTQLRMPHPPLHRMTCRLLIPPHLFPHPHHPHLHRFQRELQSATKSPHIPESFHFHVVMSFTPNASYLGLHDLAKRHVQRADSILILTTSHEALVFEEEQLLLQPRAEEEAQRQYQEKMLCLTPRRQRIDSELLTLLLASLHL